MRRPRDDHSEIPFVQYRAKQGNLILWAKRMPEAFQIELKKGLVDQRKAGAKARVQYVQTLKGKAGDYLIIANLETGARNVLPGETFEKHFVVVDSDSQESNPQP